MSVLDGHGGWQAAEFAKNHLALFLDELLKEKLTSSVEDKSKVITECLEMAYDRVEEKFLDMAERAYSMGFANTGRVGSCALSVLVNDSKVYAANIGDCKGVICSQKDDKITCTKINNK